MQLRFPVWNGGVTQGIFWQRPGKIIRAIMRFGAVHTGLILFCRMNDKMLCFQGIAVCTAGYQHGSIRRRFIADQQGRTSKT